MLFGLNKKRTELGKWLDYNGWSQEDLSHAAKLNRDTVSKACSNSDYLPSAKTMKKILKAVREVDPNVEASDFWRL